MANRSTRTTPVGKYVMKKPRPVNRGRQKTVLTLAQHIHSQRLMDAIKRAKDDIVVNAVIWGGQRYAREKATCLESLRQAIKRYKNLMTFPKRSQEIE